MRRLRRKIKKTFLNLFYRRLWLQFALVLLLIVTLPVVILGVLLINTSQNAVRRSVLSNHQQIAKRAAESVEMFIKGPKDLLISTAAILGVTEMDSWQQETVLVELALDNPVFIRVASFNTDGKEIASSEMASRDFLYAKRLVQTINNNMTFFSDMSFMDDGTPYITVAVPVRRLGRVVGGVVGDINLRGLWDIVDTIKLDNTGIAFLVSGDGTVIAHRDKKLVLRNGSFADFKDVQSVLSGKTDALEIEDRLGNRWISAFSPINSLKWGIVLRQDQKEAYLFSRVMKVQSWFIILLSEIVVVFVAVFMARVLIQPIRSLMLRIKKVSQGDFDHKLSMRRRDEIGELIRSFNIMTVKLKKARAKERFSAIGEAAAWIAHELKNSLVSIKSFIQLFPSRHMDKKFVDRFSKIIPE